MFIYMIINKINGKYYIGKTTKTIEERWNRHIKGARYSRETPLYRAIRKYGKHNFETRSVLSLVNNLDDAEKYFIRFFKSFDPKYGYNCTLGGEGGTPTEETRIKLSNNRKGKIPPPFTEEHKRKISISLTGRKRPLTDCRKMSKTRKGRKFSEQTKEKMRQSHLGKPLSEEHKKAVKQGKLYAKHKGASGPIEPLCG